MLQCLCKDMILDGKVVASSIKQELLNYNFNGSLIIIQVGDDLASTKYVNSRKKLCDEVGLATELIKLDESISYEALKDIILEYNSDVTVSGIQIQMPVPKHLIGIEKYIDSTKDVDAMTHITAGLNFLSDAKFKPCTVKSVIDILHYYNIKLDGANCVVVGRSNIVGKPLAIELLKENATVTICHSHTKDLNNILKSADIIITAIGKAKFINSKFDINEQSTIIDVGINFDENGKMCGDVDFEYFKDRVKNITPVPGGVGAVTTVELLKNTMLAEK